MTKIQSIYAFVGMIVVIGGAAFGMFKWMDSREDADADVVVWIEEQEIIHEADQLFKTQVMSGINLLVVKTDSAIALGVANQRAIYANRRTIMQQIQHDTSLTREEVIELMKPFMEGIEDLKKNNGWTLYGIE